MCQHPPSSPLGRIHNCLPLAFVPSQLVEQAEFAEMVKEDAASLEKRQETDSVPLVDDIRYHIASNVQTYSAIEEANQKLEALEELLARINIDCWEVCRFVMQLQWKLRAFFFKWWILCKEVTSTSSKTKVKKKHMHLYVCSFYFIFSILHRIYIWKELVMFGADVQRAVRCGCLTFLWETYQLWQNIFCKMGSEEIMCNIFTTDYKMSLHCEHVCFI